MAEDRSIGRRPPRKAPNAGRALSSVNRGPGFESYPGSQSSIPEVHIRHHFAHCLVALRSVLLQNRFHYHPQRWGECPRLTAPAGSGQRPPLFSGWFSREKGRRPASALYSTTPNEKISLRAPVFCPEACSGDMYGMVPITMPVRVAVSSAWRSGLTGFCRETRSRDRANRFLRSRPGNAVPIPRDLLVVPSKGTPSRVRSAFH